MDMTKETRSDLQTFADQLIAFAETIKKIEPFLSLQIPELPQVGFQKQDLKHPILEKEWRVPSDVAKFIGRTTRCVQDRCKKQKYTTRPLGPTKPNGSQEYLVLSESVWNSRMQFDDEWRE